MRPTFLQFRSPKERTPDPYDIKVTCDGSHLIYPKSKSPTFSREKRFKQYNDEARKTGYMLGPGSYSYIGGSKIKGGYLYKPLNGIRGDVKDAYYVGQILVRENYNRGFKATEQD